MSDPIKTVCPYCGVGCGLEVVPTVKGDKITGISKVRGDRSHPSSQGMVCVKGATVAESIGKDRLLHPMLRDSLDEPFRRVTWEQAIDRLVSEIQKVRSNWGANAICMYGSGQFVTEDYYVAQKLMKGALGTNNFDANSRLCMSSAVMGYLQSLGSDGPPCCYDDLELTDCAFLIGTNTAECHPIVFNRLRKHHKQNPHVKLIVVDPRCTPTAEVADLHLAIKPGTDIDLLNGIAYLLLEWNYFDAEFIEECTNGFAEFTDVVRQYSPDVVADRCGISIEDLKTAAQYWGESYRVLSMWSMGINQSSEGTAKARSLINLHLMTGQIGRAGAGPFSLTGQPNAMGGREAGGLSHLLPGYRSISNSQHRSEVEHFWNFPAGQIQAERGRSTWEMIEGLESGDVKLLWIAATNPAVSLPDLERAKKALRRSPFTVYQEAYYPTETVVFAHLLLPATQWSEKTGVMTNSERRVALCPSFQSPDGEAKEDWAIFAEVGRRLGFVEQFNYTTSAEVFAEFAKLTHNRPCDMSGLSHDRLRDQGPTQWPYPVGETKRSPASSQRLYTNLQFATPDHRARFGAVHSKGLAEPHDSAYPFVLTTGRVYGHWHTMTRTGRTEKIQQLHPNPFLEIHPRDAKELGIIEGNMVEVRSRRGSAKLAAKVTRSISPGTVFMPMHWGALWADDAEVNALMHSAACPDSLQPELKACAVQVIPLTAVVTARSEEFDRVTATPAAI